MSHCPAAVQERVSICTSAGFAVSVQESHCFNYSHVITSINWNVFVCVCVFLEGVGDVNASVNCWKTKRWENWNYIPCNQPGDKLEALISTLTDSLSLARAAISHSSTQTGRYDCKACGTEFGRADLAAAQTQASVANPLYSPINLHGCAHPVRTPVWACQHSPMEPGTELCRQYGHQAHYRPNQILLIARVRPRSLL